ncbi:MAG: hypothetical protein LBT43_05875 [Prevotella sp.]|nr:hypothetical protein [Prevotella sp.]
MEETLASLPKTTRKIFEMSRFGNLSKKDIAKTMNMSHDLRVLYYFYSYPFILF